MDQQAGQGGDRPRRRGSAESANGPAGTGARRADAALAAAEASLPETGEPRVDAALQLLRQLPELPLAEHAAVFERVHAELSDVLGELDPESAGDGD